MPTPISPEMVSPATLPVKASVSGIGLVIEIFQATSSPLTVPSKIGPDWPSAPCVPVSVPPSLFSVKSALRSPIGVLMVIFQFPSTDIVFPFSNGCGFKHRHVTARARCARGEPPQLRSGAGGADPIGHQDAERDVLYAESRDFGADRD